MQETTKGVLDGVNTLIDRHFFAASQYQDFRHEHKRSCIELSKKPPSSFDGVSLVAAIYKRIEENLVARPKRIPSPENWKLRSTALIDGIKAAANNCSEEVTLERAIVQREPKRWTYQMPIAAGLFGKDLDKRRAVDLVCQHGNDRYDFVELKIESDTPLYAAMEILGYGLVYLASRVDSAKNLHYATDTSRPVLLAKEINLVVLAPSIYYENRYNLKWLELGLKDGLNKLLKDKVVTGLKMDFRFEQFPENLWNSQLTPANLPDEFPRKPLYP